MNHVNIPNSYNCQFFSLSVRTKRMLNLYVNLLLSNLWTGKCIFNEFFGVLIQGKLGIMVVCIYLRSEVHFVTKIVKPCCSIL